MSDLLKHIVDAVCRCEYCTMIDVMWGDPGLSPWEFSFVENVSYQGWLADYSDKQKVKIRQIYTKRKKELSERS